MSILRDVLKVFLQRIEGSDDEDELSVITWDSSAISSITYFKDERIMEVIFNSGGRYLYYDVSPQRFNAFKDANSIGRYFVYNIRENYIYSGG